MSWREQASKVIGDVVAQYGKTDMKLIRSKLREAYPFGERKYHPYKIGASAIGNKKAKDCKRR